MNRLIARLIGAGMPRKIALHMYGLFKRQGRLDEFEQYVEAVEDEARVDAV